jgi:hypothetical protein
MKLFGAISQKTTISKYIMTVFPMTRTFLKNLNNSFILASLSGIIPNQLVQMFINSLALLVYPFSGYSIVETKLVETEIDPLSINFLHYRTSLKQLNYIFCRRF